MSNTLRKDKYNKVVKDGLKEKDKHYKCNCWHCTGYDAQDKYELKAKIAEKELKEEISTVEKGENIDFDIPEQDEILQQIMGRI